MLRLTATIEIKGEKGRWLFKRVTGVEIVRDTETLTDTCILRLPKKVKWEVNGKAEPIPLRRGDEVSVWLGYDDDLELAFSGFVTTIGIKTPIEITAEDWMFTLKAKAAVKKSYRSATISQILADQNLGIEVRVFGEQHVGPYRVTASTVAELLGHLKDHGGIRSFIRYENGKPVLFAGVLFERAKAGRWVFCTGRNLIDYSSLKVQSAEDVKIKVKAVSLGAENKKKRVEVGDADGEVRTLHTYNKSEKELKEWAQQELKRLKRDGLTGSFTTFGSPLVDKLDAVAIKIDGARKGVYQVQRNTIKYDSGGFRQEITLGEMVEKGE